MSKKQAKIESVREEFDRWAQDGCIGSRDRGKLAYAYFRVSTTNQAEKYGLQRQVEHCHEIALQQGYTIPWSLVFLDDESAYSLDRPGMMALRAEIKKIASRRANALVFEELPRVSRDMIDQHTLAKELGIYSVALIAYTPIPDELSWLLQGFMSDFGMKEQIRKMAAGTRTKAKSGKVTARVRAYGLVFCDSTDTPLSKPGKDTHYMHHEIESQAVKLIFETVASRRLSLRGLAAELSVYPVPNKGAAHWTVSAIHSILKNPVYKGSFIFGRTKRVKVTVPTRNGDTKTVRRLINQPEENWIEVKVTPIVTPELWAAANAQLTKNKLVASNNARREYLLTGLVRCALCGSHFYGRGRHNKDTCDYYCASHKSKDQPPCKNPQISASTLDNAVWRLVFEALTRPKLLIERLESAAYGEDNRQLLAEIEGLESLLAAQSIKEERLYAAYQAGAFGVEKYTQRQKALDEEKRNLSVRLEDRQSRVISPDELAERKAGVMALAKAAREGKITLDMPFEQRKQLIGLIVREVIWDGRKREFQLVGATDDAFSVMVPLTRPG